MHLSYNSWSSPRPSFINKSIKFKTLISHQHHVKGGSKCEEEKNCSEFSDVVALRDESVLFMFILKFNFLLYIMHTHSMFQLHHHACSLSYIFVLLFLEEGEYPIS